MQPVYEMPAQKRKSTQQQITSFLAALLSLTLFLGLFQAFPASVQAADEEPAQPADVLPAYTLSLIRILDGEEENYEYALVDAKGNRYLSELALARCTGYTFHRDEMLWKRYEDDKYDTQKKTIYLSGRDDGTWHLLARSWDVELPGILQYGGLYYFPAAWMLPVMDTVASVEDGALVIERVGVTFVDAFHDLNLQDLMFTHEKELGDSLFLGGAIVIPSYLFDTVRNFRIDRVSPVGQLRDFNTAMGNLMTDRDAYEAAFTMYDLSDDERQVGYADKLMKGSSLSAKAIKLIRQLSDFTDHTEEFLEAMPQDIYDTIQTVGKGAKYTRMVIKTVKNYCLMLKDNRDMFRTVYLSSSSKKQSTKQKAARRIVKLYSDMDIAHMAFDLGEQIILDMTDDSLEAGLVLLTHSFAWEAVAVELGGEAMNELLKGAGLTDTEGLALLYYYIDLAADGEAMYRKYEEEYKYTSETIQNLRLSAMLTLLASKKCYEIMRDNTMEDSGDPLDAQYRSYCQNRIDLIVKHLSLLYLSADSTLADGMSYFDEATSYLKEQQLLLQPQSEPEGIRTYYKVLKEYRDKRVYTADGQQESVDYAYRLEDVDGDGKKEFILCVFHDPEGEVLYDGHYGVSYVRIYRETEGTPEIVYETDYSDQHTETAMIALTRNQQGVPGLLCYSMTNWQGYCSYGLDFTDFQGNPYGNWNYVEGVEIYQDDFTPQALQPLATALSAFPSFQAGTIRDELIYDKNDWKSIPRSYTGFGFLEEEESWIP